MLNQTTTHTAKSAAEVTTVFVYGYGACKTPFYQEARGKQLNANHWLLLLSAPVTHGQKLLLIGAVGRDPVAAEIVTMRSVTGEMFEVAVALAG